MNKSIFTLLSVALFTLFCANRVSAQNLQLYYDMGSLANEKLSTRPAARATFEMLAPDKYGSTFILTDANIGSGGADMVFLEVIRSLKFWDMPLHIHLEYNGGLSAAHPLHNMGLLGLSYLFSNEDHSKTLSLAASYKYTHKGATVNSFQLAAYWNVYFAGGLFNTMGFLKYWQEDRGYAKDMILNSNQFWMNLNKLKGVSKDLNLSIGGKLELSQNHYCEGFSAIPMVGAKWSF